MVLGGGGQQFGLGAGACMEPTKSALTALLPAQPQHVGMRYDQPLPHVYLAVVGGDEQHGTGR